jgi:hypothetical protein
VRRVVLPNEEWRELGAHRRREIARHARHGRQHPDPYVAAVARAWAAQTVPDAPGRQVPKVGSVIAWTGWAALLGLVGAVLGDAAHALLPGGSDWRERRLARRILIAARE